ncbi:sulfurtransferase TusA family protein [Paraferrimonas sp. SM1919]|uniref:sulfurtransferase TusA family protein n=1 Tax=Paraferrimonas sp. SM1919 TaxID=2662263 RepID=UPI0034CD5C5E
MVYLDYRHLHCPLPLVKTKMFLKEHASQLPITVLVKDSASISDLPKYLIKKGYNISCGANELGFEILINHSTIGTTAPHV